MSSHLPPVEEAPHIAQVAMWFSLAGVGGAVKYISAVIRAREPVSNRRFLLLLGANIFISSFCGLMGGLLVSTVTADQTWHYIACGMLGYAGTQGLDLVMLALKKKVSPISTVIPLPPSVDPSLSRE